MEIKYFDHAATTQIRKEVLEEMMPYLDKEYGNPSSTHIKGTRAKEAIENARNIIVNCINSEPEEIYFTSGGSESDNTAIKGFARANKKKGNHIITTQIEHKAVLESCRELEDEGFEITYLGVDKYGLINLDELENAIKSNTILISVMFANNEIGTIEPIKDIAEIAHKHNIAFHTDAVQAMGNVEIDVKKLNIDMLSMSGHKFYGPKGIGVLYANKNILFNPIISGGGQERKKRSGTENVANIVGMAKALEIATQNIYEYNQKLLIMRETFFEELNRLLDNKFKIKLNGHPIKRLKGNINISIEGIDAEALLLLLSEKGYCISTASACSSNSKHTSYVLKAIGLNEKQANGTIRITMGKDNSIKDVKGLASSINQIINKIAEM